MRFVELVGPIWSSASVGLADSFVERWQGLLPHPAGRMLLIRARSVHTFGMRTWLNVVAIDHDGVVRSVFRVPPNRVIADKHATWFLELPVESEPPPIGMRLSMPTGSVAL